MDIKIGFIYRTTYWWNSRPFQTITFQKNGCILAFLYTTMITWTFYITSINTYASLLDQGAFSIKSDFLDYKESLVN